MRPCKITNNCCIKRVRITNGFSYFHVERQCLFLNPTSFCELKFPLNFLTSVCLVAQSCPTLCDPMAWSLPGSSVHGDSPGKNTGVHCHALYQGIFPTQGSNSSLPHCGRIPYCLSHQGNPRIMEWIAYPFSRGSS